MITAKQVLGLLEDVEVMNPHLDPGSDKIDKSGDEDPNKDHSLEDQKEEEDKKDYEDSDMPNFVKDKIKDDEEGEEDDD